MSGDSYRGRILRSRWYWLTGDLIAAGLGIYLTLVTPWPAKALTLAFIAIMGFLVAQDVRR